MIIEFRFDPVLFYFILVQTREFEATKFLILRVFKNQKGLF